MKISLGLLFVVAALTGCGSDASSTDAENKAFKNPDKSTMKPPPPDAMKPPANFKSSIDGVGGAAAPGPGGK